MNNIISTSYKRWTLLMALIVAFSCVGYSPVPSYMYPIMLFISSIFVFLQSFGGRKVRLSNSLLFVIAISFLSIVIGQPDPRFRSLQRLVYFIALVLSVSPLVRTTKLTYQRHLLLQYLLYFIVFLSVGSFICYFLGINRMQIGEDSLYLEDFSIGGTFGGLVKHSMLLGPMCVMSFIYLLTTQNKYLSIGWINKILILSSIGGLLVSASRGAIIGGAIAFLFVIYNKSHNKLRFIKILIVISVLIVATFPLWRFLISGIIYKNEYRSDAGSGFLVSRMFLYKHRLNEFLTNPFTGIGFSSAKSFNYLEVHQTGTVEYGNSWLCLFSTIGLLGAIPAIYLFLTRFFYNIRRIKVSQEALFISALLLFFFIHFMIEGYVLAAGNPLCFFFWLILANSYESNLRT